MRITSVALGVAGALTASAASAQAVNLTGQYQCVQSCPPGALGPAYITQNGWDMNVTNELGEPTRAWIDWYGHIWFPSWNEGAIYSPDGLSIQFDRGTVWQRELAPPPLPPPPPVTAYRRPPAQTAYRRPPPPPPATHPAPAPLPR